MSGKDEHADTISTERAMAAKQEYMLKGPKADSFSATNPGLYIYKPVFGSEAQEASSEEEGAA